MINPPVEPTDAPNPQTPTDAEHTAKGKTSRRWIFAAAGGILAILVVAAIVAGGSPSDATAASQCPTPTPCDKPSPCPTANDSCKELEKQLTESASALDQRAEELDQREAALDAREGELTLAEEAALAESFGAGIQLIGADIEPGQYRATGGSMCYWERLNATTGDFDAIIANDLPSGQAIVTILPSDYAFSSSDCGLWEKIG